MHTNTGDQSQSSIIIDIIVRSSRQSRRATAHRRRVERRQMYGSSKIAAEIISKLLRKRKHVRQQAECECTSFHTTPPAAKNTWFLGVVYLYSACHFRFRGRGSKNYFYEIRANPVRKLYLKFFRNMKCLKLNSKLI